MPVVCVCLAPVEPEVRVAHPATAPDVRRAVCNGTCVFDGWSLDNPEELHPLPPDISSPVEESDDGEGNIVSDQFPAFRSTGLPLGSGNGSFASCSRIGASVGVASVASASHCSTTWANVVNSFH